MQLLQGSMERKRAEINDLQELMQPLSEQLPEVESRVEEIGDKLDALCGIIEAQASRVSIDIDCMYNVQDNLKHCIDICFL